MPWQPGGTFLRVNPDYSAIDGSLWQQDLTASIKIIAFRHDYHDQDLADGIAASLNLDGLNEMRAALNFGGFQGVNVAAASLANDVPQYQQLAGAMLFDDGLRVLTLNDREGNTIDTVTIPSGSGGGGEGTVSQIDIDPTLEAPVNPITTIGSIGLKAIQTGQSYSGGISAIVVDDYGRVTQVTTGAYANTNLSTSRTLNQVTIASSTGTNAVILAASSTLSGVMTSQMFDNLANTVRLTGAQDIDGVKTLLAQLFATGGITITNGEFRVQSLPTSDPGQPGDFWNDGGTVKVSL